jgi:hypothetical protein
LGHKRAFCGATAMSALLPKADIRSATASKVMTFVSPWPARPADQDEKRTYADHRLTE